jgi:hypothetical protein
LSAFLVFFGLDNRDTRQGGGAIRGSIRGRGGSAGENQRACMMDGGGAAEGWGAKKVREYNVTSNNVTRKHTNSTMQIIEIKCKAKTGCWDKGLTSNNFFMVFVDYKN